MFIVHDFISFSLLAWILSVLGYSDNIDSYESILPPANYKHFLIQVRALFPMKFTPLFIAMDFIKTTMKISKLQ